MSKDNKDFKSLIELGVKGDSLLIETEYRRECSSFKDETHFYCHADNIRLLCSDIESKKAESNAFLKSLSSLNKRHIALRNVEGLIDELEMVSNRSLTIDRKSLCSLLTPNLIMELRDGYALKALETLLFGSSCISESFCDMFTSYIKSIQQCQLDELVKLPLLVAFLIEGKIRVETMVVFTSTYLNRNYGSLTNKDLAGIFTSTQFKSVMKTYSLKSNSGDLMMVVREFLKLLNASYHSFVLSLRRKVVKLQGYRHLTNNREFNHAYTSIDVFMEKTPTARDILDITTIPRRTVYRLLSVTNELKD